MKRIIILLYMLSAFMAVKAQIPVYTGYTNINTRYQWYGGLFQALGIPAGNTATFQTGQLPRAGALYYDSTGADSGLYYYSGLAWRKAGSDGVTNIATGLGLSGGPITTTGTILVDTASASIISRQRAAATYQLIGDYLTEDGWYNIVRDGGADSTGVIDVSTIIQAALNAGWKNIFIPHGTFLVSTQIAMRDSVTIIGAGRFASRIKLTTDIEAFHCSPTLGGNNTIFSNIGFYGDYASGGTTAQRGIAIDSANRVLITGISAQNIGGFAVNIRANGHCCASYVATAGRSNVVTDSYFELNYGAVNFDVRGEYNEISNSVFTGNVYAIQNIGGNNRIISNSVVNNTWGLYMTSGTNGGHGFANGNTFNHNGSAGSGANIYMNGITLGFNFSNNSFAQNITSTAGLFEMISCSDITWQGGYVTNDTVRTTLCTNIVFSDMRKYSSTVPVFVVVSGQAPTVSNTGKVINSFTLFDPVNSKQLDITHLNGKVNFTGTSGIKFGFLNSAADSTVDITGSLKVSAGVRFTGLPTAVGTKALRIDATGKLSVVDTSSVSVSSQWINGSNGIYYPRYVGIGVDPLYLFHVKDAAGYEYMKIDSTLKETIHKNLAHVFKTTNVATSNGLLSFYDVGASKGKGSFGFIDGVGSANTNFQFDQEFHWANVEADTVRLLTSNFVSISDSANYYMAVIRKDSKRIGYSYWPSGTGGGSGGGNVYKSGTPTQYQWANWINDSTIKGNSVTASKLVATNANGEPTTVDVTPTEGGYLKGVTDSIQNQFARKFTLMTFANSYAAPGDAETRYWFATPAAVTSSITDYAMTIDRTCTLSSISIDVNCGTAGSNESWTIYVRNTTTSTDYAIAAVALSANRRTWGNTAINIPVTLGDKLVIKSITPTWATNPAVCSIFGYASFK